MSQEVFKVILGGREMWRCCDSTTGMMSLDEATIERPVDSVDLAVEKLVAAGGLRTDPEREALRTRLSADLAEPEKYRNGDFVVDLDGFFEAVSRLTSECGSDCPALTETEKEGLKNIAQVIAGEARGCEAWRELAAYVRETGIGDALKLKLFPEVDTGKFVPDPSLSSREVTALDGGLRYFDFLAGSTELGRKSVLMIHSAKVALQEAVLAYPDMLAPEGMILTLLEESGEFDSQVSFTFEEISYLCDTLIPWALQNKPFGDPVRCALGVMLLDNLEKQLRPEFETGGEVVDCSSDPGKIMLELREGMLGEASWPIAGLIHEEVDDVGCRVICVVKEKDGKLYLVGVRKHPDQVSTSETPLEPVEDLPPEVAQRLGEAWEWNMGQSE